MADFAGASATKERSLKHWRQVVLNHQRRRAIKVYKNLEKIRTRMNDDDQVRVLTTI